MATDVSLLGKTGEWEACGWVVVQLDYDEVMGPLCGMYGSMEAEPEIQRTIKRVRADGICTLLKRVLGPIKVHVYNKGIIDGSRKVDDLAEKGILVEVEHVMAHRTKKGKETHVEV